MRKLRPALFSSGSSRPSGEASKATPSTQEEIAARIKTKMSELKEINTQIHAYQHGGSCLDPEVGQMIAELTKKQQTLSEQLQGLLASIQSSKTGVSLSS
jgi:hypothetical protein